MKSSCLLWAGIWSFIVGSAVIGRMIEGDSETEVVEENPSLTREQAVEWSHEFFRSVFPKGSSYLEPLDHVLDRAERNFESFPPTKNHRLNTRHYDVSKVSGASGTQPVVNVDNLEWMLRNIFTYPRSHTTNETAKEIVKKYITDSFQRTIQLPTTLQYFKPQQFLDVYDGELPVGANIIAVIKGTTWSTPNDRPLLVGAHWDTVNFTPGTDDNGSGVAATLEAARALAHSSCTPKYSIIFVAFDLEETGSQGSLVFIKDYLVTLLDSAGISKQSNLANFQGAFIMDTIMDFNETDGSQTFPTDWSLLLPDIYEEVADENYRGDFMSVIYRKNVDNVMADKFRYHWTKTEPLHSAKFKIKPFPLRLEAEMPEMSMLSHHLNFLRSDHARFWYMNDTDVPTTLNAVLITDTGPYRGNMRNCYHTVCDGPEISVYNNTPNLQFLAKATQALVDTLADMSQCQFSTHGRNDNENQLNQRREGLNSAAMRSNSLFHNLVKFVTWFQS